jgi:hypothetical protein
MVHASAVLFGDPADAADAAVPAVADEPPPAAAVPAEMLDDELPEQAVRLSAHRPAPNVASCVYLRIDEVVMRIAKQLAVMAE